MAALGQMSAGMVHELNQPLTALRTLSDSAGILLDQQRLDEVRGNLQRIDRHGRPPGATHFAAEDLRPQERLAAAPMLPLARAIADAQAVVGAALKPSMPWRSRSTSGRRPRGDGRRGRAQQRARQPDAQRDRRDGRRAGAHAGDLGVGRTHGGVTS